MSDKSPLDPTPSKRAVAREQRTLLSRRRVGHWTWELVASTLHPLSLAARRHGYQASVAMPGATLELVLVPMLPIYTPEAAAVIADLADVVRGRPMEPGQPRASIHGAWCERILLHTGHVIAVQIYR